MSYVPRHQCFIHRGAPATHLAEIAQTLIARLQSSHRCLYLNSPAMIAGMRGHLAAGGIDLATEIARGALVLSSERRHLHNGIFEVERMIALLEEAVRQARADGYVGLWASGDVMWEFGGQANLAKLLEYERSLEEFMRGNPALSGICLYHCDTLPPEAVETALLTHPSVYRGADLSEINPRYYEGLGRLA